MTILVKDNFFDGIDILRAIAISSDYMYHLKTPETVGLKGYRTWELSHLDNPIIEECCNNILKCMNVGEQLTISYNEEESKDS